MLPTDPAGPGLIARIYVEATDPAQLPASLSMDIVWIILSRRVWSGSISDEILPPGEQKPNRIGGITRNGPTWDGYVDVVVRVLEGRGKAYMLKASHQEISRVY
jgi:hypothetical protein